MGKLLSMIGVASALHVPMRMGPVEWIEESVDLTRDPTSAAGGLVKLDPYQVEPIEAQFLEGVNEVVVMAPPQTGKSFCWRLPLLFKIMHVPGPRWIIYESDDKAEDINAQQFDPLLRSIPALQRRLDAAGRFSSVRRQYRFPTGPVDFSGAGSEPTSKPERDGVADELDTWPLTNTAKRKTLASFRDRFATWWRKGEGCLVICSSPNGQSSAIGYEYDRSSKGRWHLQCQGCWKETIPSHRVDNLQWETTADGIVIADSLRLICPVCQYQHAEAEAVAMNEGGRYIHALPNHKRRGFQWGALASPRTKSWAWVAEMQMDAGSTAPLDVLENFAKCVKGVPFRPRQVMRDQVDAIKQHIGELPDPDDLCGLFFAADTQDNSFYWIVRAIDIHRNTYLLDYGQAANEGELMEKWDAEYMGHQCIIGVIDEGGHRLGDVKAMVKDRPGLYTYKGNPRIVKWIRMKKSTYRINANPWHYQSELLYHLYTQTNREKGNYMYLPQNASAEYMAQLGSVQPDKKIKNGHHYENWKAGDGADDHLFDCEKMWRFVLDFAESELRAVDWLIPPPWLFDKPAAKRRRPLINME